MEGSANASGSTFSVKVTRDLFSIWIELQDGTVKVGQLSELTPTNNCNKRRWAMG